MTKKSALPNRPRKKRHPSTWRVLRRLGEIRLARALRLHTSPGERAKVVEVDREHGLADYHLSRIIRGHVGLALDKLFEILDLLREDAPSFLAEALGLGEVNALRLLEEVEAEHLRDADPFAELGVEPLPAPSAEPGTVDPALEERLLRLDERRFVDPQAALPEATALSAELEALCAADPSRARVELLCRCRGALGSIARTLPGGFGAASRCLRSALELAERHELGGARIDLLQRAASLMSSKGRDVAAVLLARSSRDESVLAGDDFALGRALVTLGSMSERAGRLADARRCWRAGADRLPEWVWWGRVTVFQGLAVAALEEGQTEEAARELRRAAAAAEGRHGAFRNRLAWAEGEVALAGGRYSEAEVRFLKAKESMRHPLETGLVSLRLALAQLRAGEQDKLRQTGAELVTLLLPLGRERLAMRTLAAVVRAVMAGEIRERTLLQATRRLWRGYPSLAAYPLHPSL